MKNKLVSNILYILRYGTISHAWTWLAYLIIKLGGVKLAAYLSYLSIDWGEMKHGKTILCLHRESFVKDVAELRKRTNINYPIITGGYTRFQMAWFPQPMQIQTFYKTHNNDKAFKMSSEYAHQLIRLVNKKSHVDAILSANFDYWQDAGFKIACNELNIPFLVLSREHAVIPEACNEVIEWYEKSNYKFKGTAIAVAGHTTKDAILKVNNLCKPEQVKVTGLPRYDAWLDVDTSVMLNERPYITLLTFTKCYYADDTFKEVLQLFCKSALKNTDSSVTFLIKSKDVSDTQEVLKLMSEFGLTGVECSHEYDLFDVLPRSRAVINYNSLALVEAVMAKAKVIIPAWGECKDSGPTVLYVANNPDVARVVDFVYSPEDFLAVINSSILSDVSLPLNVDVLKFINEFIHVPESGTYCKEFEGFIEQYITAN